MDGWRPVEELAHWGFTRSPVVMANEAHNGLTRCVRTRDVGVRIINAAHQAGVRRLAMEALPWPADGSPGPIRAAPPQPGGYLAQPDMRSLITTALELGSSLWAYEAVIDPGKDNAELHSLEFTNWREREQAARRSVPVQWIRSLSGAETVTRASRRAANGCRWATTSRPCPASSNS